MNIQLPTGFTARPATLDDLQTVVDVMNAVTQADVGKSDTTPFSVGRYWAGGDMNLETDTLLIFAPDGQAAGCAQFIAETPPTPYDVDTWVHPAFVESGVGEALLQWIDQRAQQALIAGSGGRARLDRAHLRLRAKPIGPAAPGEIRLHARTHLLSHGDRVRCAAA